MHVNISIKHKHRMRVLPSIFTCSRFVPQKKPALSSPTRLPEAAAPECIHVHKQFEEKHGVEKGLEAIKEVGIPQTDT